MLSLPCRQLKAPLAANVFRFAKFQTLRSLTRNSQQGQTFTRARAGVKEAYRNILNTETTGAPFAYGRLIAAGGAVLGVGALCFYGLGLSGEAGAIDQAAYWPQYVRDRIHSTYLYLAGGLGLTAGSAALVFRSPTLTNMMTKNSMLALVGMFAAMIGTSVMCQSISYSPETLPAKLVAWAAHCAVMGAIIAPLGTVGGPIILRAALYSAGIIGGLSMIAACAPSDKFLNMGGALGIGLGVVFAASIGTFFLPPTNMMGAGLYSVAVYGGLVLFAAFLLYDTQRLVHQAKSAPTPWQGSTDLAFDPINAQLSIYANVLNIFIRMVSILSMGGGSKRK